MSMSGYPWDLEERVEDAIVAYIKQQAGGEMMVIPWRSIEEARYPLVVVQYEDSNNTTEDQEFSGRRQMTIRVSITTEAVNNNGDAGTVRANMTAREIHRQVKSSVIGALAGKTIQDDLNAIGSEGVNFSFCQMTAQSGDAGDGMIITEQELIVIAQPKEI